jgi:hypothetical protein
MAEKLDTTPGKMRIFVKARMKNKKYTVTGDLKDDDSVIKVARAS